MKSLVNITLTEIVDICTISSPKHRRLSITNRPFYGLSFCRSGQITYTHNGRSFVSDPSHAILLPKGQSYTLHGDETGSFPLINFQCTDSFFSDTFLTCALQNPESYWKDFDHLYHLTLFPGNHTKIMSLLYDLFGRVAAEAVRERDMLAPCLTCIQDHYMDPTLDNTRLALEANISEVYFRRLFREKYGMPPGQYLTNVRIRRARQLLESSWLSVTEIAGQSGFSSVYHFCRAFKNNTGMTPTDYRKEARKRRY